VRVPNKQQTLHVAASTIDVNPSRLIDLLRSTLERVEQSEQSDEQQSAVRKLRRSVVLAIAESELQKMEPLAPETSFNPANSAA
jgi:hypothetical protein